LGSGEEERALRAETQRLGLGASIYWLGFRSQDEIPKFLQAADAFVHPSQWDPWPYAVLDAASSGLPLILSNRTGCHSDWMADPCCAVTYSCGNVEALAGVMRKMVNDTETRMILGRNALQQSSRHTELEYCKIFEHEVGNVMNKLKKI
jgi:glycosyltransferase involved in cell wall biosynthesis